MREVLSQSDAHFLHAEKPLDLLLRPPIPEPRVLTWSGEELVVVGRAGTVYVVEPSFGTREWGRAAADPMACVIGRERLAVLSRTGLLQVWSWPDGALLWEKQTAFSAASQLAFWRSGVAVIGQADGVRRTLVLNDDGRSRAKARVLPKTALGVTGDGHLMLARSTASGLSVLPFGKPLPGDEATEHVLRFGTDLAVVGIATGGATVWHAPGAPPVNVKLFEVTVAALNRDGDQVALGTRSGGVAIADARIGSSARVRPGRVEGHEGPILTLEFSQRGRWLASAAERCIVWGY